MHFEIYEGEDKAGGQKGKWRWRLKADNGRTIADSGEGYVSSTECLRMVNEIKKLCPTAEVRGGAAKKSTPAAKPSAPTKRPISERLAELMTKTAKKPTK